MMSSLDGLLVFSQLRKLLMTSDNLEQVPGALANQLAAVEVRTHSDLRGDGWHFQRSGGPELAAASGLQD